MANQHDKKETVTLEEAMMNLLERKGQLSREEVMKEIFEMKKKARK